MYDSIGDVHCDSAEVLVRVLPGSTLREIANLTPQVRKHQVAMVTSMLRSKTVPEPYSLSLSHTHTRTCTGHMHHVQCHWHM